MTGEIVSIPVRTWRGRFLCWLNRHQWTTTGATSVVIPTGNALLVKERRQLTYCQRVGCTAKREAVYRREEIT